MEGVTWQDTASVIVSTRGTAADILEGKGEERVFLRFPTSVPKLTPAELDHADALMRAWDAHRTNEAKEAA
jgi:hypothetical protein